MEKSALVGLMDGGLSLQRPLYRNEVSAKYVSTTHERTTKCQPPLTTRCIELSSVPLSMELYRLQGASSFEESDCGIHLEKQGTDGGPTEGPTNSRPWQAAASSPPKGPLGRADQGCHSARRVNVGKFSAHHPLEPPVVVPSWEFLSGCKAHPSRSAPAGGIFRTAPPTTSATRCVLNLLPESLIVALF